MKRIPVKLKPGPAKEHAQSNRRYMMSLEPARLLANFYIQAGLNSNRDHLPRHYGGWEEPDAQVRGNIAGHYLSACAMAAKYAGDRELEARALFMVDELARCQAENEDGWCGSIPPVYLDRIARGKWVWAPHYNVHKTLMGLSDTYRFCGYDPAERIADRWADWFLNWTERHADIMPAILDNETGGMAEVWAELYAATGKEKYLELLKRYLRRHFFEPLRDGKDILTHTHANTTIPEAHGMAAAYGATAEEEYRFFAEKYLDCALDREHYCTGGQTSGEGWIKNIVYGNLGTQNQEHCTVYNMIRLCEYVMEYNPDVRFAEYIERNVWNGLMAQHRLKDGMNTYYLPLGAGVKKEWSTPENHMTCCLGTTLQANASYEGRILFEDEKGLVLSQYLPFEAEIPYAGTAVNLDFDILYPGLNQIRPKTRVFALSVRCEAEAEFSLTVRVPGWSPETEITVNGERFARFDDGAARWVEIRRVWRDDQVEIVCKPVLQTVFLENGEAFAVTYGPEVLAGLTTDPRALAGADPRNISEHLSPRAVNDWAKGVEDWQCSCSGGHTVFKPLRNIDEETYTVYFYSDRKRD